MKPRGLHPNPSTPTLPFSGLLAALRLAIGTGDGNEDAAALDGVADWGALAYLARRHRVAPLTLSGIQAASMQSCDAETALTHLRRKTTRRGLRQLAGLRTATGILADHGIPSLVLKGLPLSVRLFGSPLARDAIDIDLLVPHAAVPSAQQALQQGGWRLLKPSFRPAPARTRCYDRFAKDRLLVGPGGSLELHHRLLTNPHVLDVPFEELRKRAVCVDTGGFPFAALADEDLLVYLAVHGQLHRWSRLKWLCDLAALLASIDVGRFDAAVGSCRRERLDLESTLGCALLLCRECFHVGPPPGAASVPLRSRARRDLRSTRRIWCIPGGGRGLKGVARRIDETRVARAIKPSWRTIAHDLARLFVGPYDFERVNLPDRLLILYLPLRPLLWFAARRRRNASRKRRSASRPQR